jgi:hypothetical protein
MVKYSCHRHVLNRGGVALIDFISHDCYQPKLLSGSEATVQPHLSSPAGERKEERFLSRWPSVNSHSSIVEQVGSAEVR